MTFKSSITREGPFFRSDPRRTFRQNARRMLARVAEEGRADIIAQLAATSGRRAPISGIGGRVAQHVVARSTAITGKPWQVTAVVSVNTTGMTREASIATRAAGAEIEKRHHAFRRTTGRLRRARAVQTAELLRGLQ